MKLYLVRHGETQMNVDRLYYGWTDCPLNEKGKWQAQQLKKFFQNIPYERLISSSLSRATSTAEKLNEGKKVVLEREDDFRELNFGAWEARDFHYVKNNFPLEYQQWSEDWKGFSIPEGESFSEFYARVTKRLITLIEEEPEDSTVVIVSHSGVMSAMLCYLTGAGEDSFWRFLSEQGTYSLVSVRWGNIVIEKINCPLF